MTNDKAQKASPNTGPLLLVALSAATLALAIFQWIELVIVRNGGHSVCSINSHVNCEAVWNSDFAGRIHDLLGVPVAGLGVIWSAAALGLSVWLLLAARSGSGVRPATVTVRLTGLVGALACITFAVGSFRAGALCLLCLGTYALVAAFAIVAYAVLPGPFALEPGELIPAAGRALGAAVVAYLIALYPGLRTPHANSQTAALVEAASATEHVQGANARLEQFFSTLPQEYRQAISDSVAAWKLSPAQQAPFPVRELDGPIAAPVKVVEFTDIKCPHCRHFIETMREVKQHLPPGLIAIESRYFPLDSECNPAIPPQFSDHTGVRCLGAKAQICLERQPDFLTLRDRLFASQDSLTPDSVLEIASSGSLPREKLEACVKSAETEKKLQDDIQYAMLYHPTGTPLVLANGKPADPLAEFLYALALSGGDTSLPAFSKLPPAAAPVPMQ
jgi:protein-disulfide isomerase/uncharacterized membrane protein